MSNPRALQKPGFRPKQPRSIRNRMKTLIDLSEYTSSYKPAEQQDPVHAISDARDKGVKTLEEAIKSLLSRHDPHQTYRRVLITLWEEEEVWATMGTRDFSFEEYQKIIKHQVDRLGYWGDSWTKDLHGDNKQTGRDAFYRTYRKLLRIEASEHHRGAAETEAHLTQTILRSTCNPYFEASLSEANATLAPEDTETTAEPLINRLHGAAFVTETTTKAQDKSKDKDRGEEDYEKELLELGGYTEVYEEGASEGEHQDNSEQLDHSSHAIAMSDTALLSGEMLDHIEPFASSNIGRLQDDVSEPHTHECPSTTVSQASSSSSCSSIERAKVVGTAEYAQSNGITQTSERQLVKGSYRDNPRYREIMAKWNANQAKIALLLIPFETAHDTPSDSTQDEAFNQIEATSEVVKVLNDDVVDPIFSIEDKATSAFERIRPRRRGLQWPSGVAGAVDFQDWLTKFHADSLRRRRMRNTEDEALRRQRENATQRPSRLCRIGMIATRICRFINDWEAQVDKNLPEALCESVEVLVDAYRYMDRTDSGRTLKDIRQLRRQWISIRRVIHVYRYIALSFDLHAREKIERLHHAFKLAPQGSQQQATLNANLKEKLNTMARRYSKFLEVVEELRDRAPELLQYGLQDMIKATLDECSVILGRVRVVFNISAPGVATTTFNTNDGR